MPPIREDLRQPANDHRTEVQGQQEDNPPTLPVPSNPEVFVKAKFMGWRTYPDTGRPYRVWQMTEAGILKTEKGDVECPEGARVFDRGPDAGSTGRFAIQDVEGGEWKVIAWSDDTGAINALFGTAYFPAKLGDGEADPTWPRDVAHLCAMLDEIKEKVRVACSTISAAAHGARAAGLARFGLPQSDGEQVGIFKLRGYFRYDSGGPYRVWVLTADAPELRISSQWEHDDVGGPEYAIAGDELWEDRDDRSQVFRLKRADYVIARPEWWQVAHLFGGERPAWTTKQDADAAPARPAAQKSTPPAIPGWVHTAVPYDSQCAYRERPSYILKDIPGTRLQAGDVVAFAPAVAGAISIPLFRAEYEQMRSALAQIGPVWRFLEHCAHVHPRGKYVGQEPPLWDFLWDRRRWGRDASKPVLYLIRRAQEPVGKPISAASDESALFELIHECGGTLRNPAVQDD